jgi:hypothetical protein
MLSIRRLIWSKDRSWAPPPLALSSLHHRCNLIFSPLFSYLLRERTRAPRRRLLHLQVAAASSTHWSPPPCAPAGRAPPPRPLVVGRRRCGLRWSGAAAAASCRSSDAAASSDGRAPPLRPPVVGRRCCGLL